MNFQRFFFAILTITLSSQMVSAWGGRGHDTICQAAVHLVQNEELKSFLKYRVFIMGHLCNAPDTHWRDLPREVSGVGSPAHYIDPEILGLPILQIPLDFAGLVRDFTGKPNPYKPGETIKSVPNELGSVWWRADQNMRKLATLKPIFARLPVPTERKDQTDPENPYNKTTFEMLATMGLMGHFVGDVGQPYHNTSDYDGYDARHGGLHAYYEELVVAEFDENLFARIVRKARGLSGSAFNPTSSVLERMRHMSHLAASEIPAVLRADPIITESSEREEHGMTLRTPAERQSAKIGLQRFDSLIVPQMARSAKLLAQLWDEGYTKAGRPNLSVYKWFKFPHLPEFVAPDYIPSQSPPMDHQKK